MGVRRRVPAKTPWGDILGYSRAVRFGETISVSGTAASDENGNVVGKGDAYRQMVYAIRKIEASLKELGASLDDVTRTRIFTTDIARWREIAKAHKEFFGNAKPANTLVEVARFIDPDMLIEIEVEAYVG